MVTSFVRWDNELVSDRLSPWDLEPIDKNSRSNSVDRFPVLPSEIVGTLYRPRPKDWGGHRDSECDRISAALSQVMTLAIAEHFVSHVELNLHPSYTSTVEYQMDLSTIKSRLDNRFYRRASAVEFDVNYILTNALKFHQAKSDIVRSASAITDLCMEIIRSRGAVDVSAIYEQLLEKYPEERGDENADGPSTSGADAARTSTTRTRSRRLTTTHSHHGPSSNPQPSHPSSRHSTKKVVTLETPEEEEPIRYFVFSIPSIASYLFILNLFKSKKKKPRSQVARQRFRQSDSCDPRKPVATLHNGEEQRKTSLPMQLM